MINKYESEVKSISSVKRIEEKLMVIALYNEFYKNVLDDTCEDFIKSLYPSIEKTFSLTVKATRINDDGSIVDAKTFMTTFLELFSLGNFFNMPQLKENISIFKEEMDTFILANDYVNIVDKHSEIPLEDKANIVVNYLDYLSDTLSNVTEMFESGLAKNLRRDIIILLSDGLDEYLKEGIEKGTRPFEITEGLKLSMRGYTKNYLIEKFKNKEIGVKNIEDKDIRKEFRELNYKEQQIGFIGLIYDISGYSKENKKEEPEKIKEICSILNITKLEYSAATISMGLHNFKFFHKSGENDDPKKKTKK